MAFFFSLRFLPNDILEEQLPPFCLEHGKMKIFSWSWFACSICVYKIICRIWYINTYTFVLFFKFCIIFYKLPIKSHGWRSLEGCSPWGRWGRTQLSNFTFTFHFHALGKEMAIHSSVLAWRIPGTGEPGGLLSMGSHRVGHDWSDLAAASAVPII